MKISALDILQTLPQQPELKPFVSLLLWLKCCHPIPAYPSINSSVKGLKVTGGGCVVGWGVTEYYG